MLQTPPGKIKLTAEIVYGFSVGLLQDNFDNPKPTPEFHKELWAYCCLDDPAVAIAAPRGHAKSTAVTLTYVLAEVCFRASDFVVILSDTEAQSIQFLNDIKSELIKTGEEGAIREMFQIKRFLKDNEKDIIVLCEDGHQFRIIARSSGQAVRGLKWRNKRPNLIVGDDLENDEIVLNDDRREKFRRWFFGALLPCLSDTGKIRIVGTILHFDSLLERLMPPTSGPYAKFTITEGLKQYSVDPTRQWRSVKYRAHTDFDDFSEMLWEEQFGVQRYIAIRQNYIDQGIPEGYSQEYLNYPIAESNAFFRKEDFLEMDGNDKEEPGHYYISADFAISQKQKADYTVFTVVKMTNGGTLHVVDVRRDRWDSRGIIDEIFSLATRYNPELFIFEEGQIEKALKPFLLEEEEKRGIFLLFDTIRPSTDKITRAKPIQGRMRMGTVKFNKESDWYPTFEQELRRFDRGEHDDQVDSFGLIGLALLTLIPGRTTEEIEEDEYYESVYSDISQGHLISYPDELGRNGTTGY